MRSQGRPELELKIRDSEKELLAAYKASKCAVEQRRIQAVMWLRSGKSRKEVLKLSAYSRSVILSIIKNYNESGLSGLSDKRHANAGRPKLLDDEEMLLLAQTIRKDYEQGIYWQGSKVVRWLKEELGKEVHEQRAYEYLKAIGMSKQSSRPYHAKADPFSQEQFKKNTS